MIHTTFAKLKKAEACVESYTKLAVALGGVRNYGAKTLIPLDEILDSNGLADTIWTLRCTIEPAEDFTIEFTCRCAEDVLNQYEDLYPDDKRPRHAIEAARNCIIDKSRAARGAARSAALSAALSAESAARAAWSAEGAAWGAARAAWSAEGAAWSAEGAAWGAARSAEGAAWGAEGAAWGAAWSAKGADERARSAAVERQTRQFRAMLEETKQ